MGPLPVCHTPLASSYQVWSSVCPVQLYSWFVSDPFLSNQLSPDMVCFISELLRISGFHDSRCGTKVCGGVKNLSGQRKTRRAVMSIMWKWTLSCDSLSIKSLQQCWISSLCLQDIWSVLCRDLNYHRGVLVRLEFFNLDFLKKKKSIPGKMH